jgi:hypothetical protein
LSSYSPHDCPLLRTFAQLVAQLEVCNEQVATRIASAPDDATAAAIVLDCPEVVRSVTRG